MGFQVVEENTAEMRILVWNILICFLIHRRQRRVHIVRVFSTILLPKLFLD